MIDDFLTRWRFVRGMTTEFLAEATDECIDDRLGPGFVTIREQAGHLAEVQGIYQLALRGEPVDWFRVEWYGTDLGLSGFGAVFIQHESIHHGQWAAYAAIGGHRRPDGWLLNWGL